MTLSVLLLLASWFHSESRFSEEVAPVGNW